MADVSNWKVKKAVKGQPEGRRCSEANLIDSFSDCERGLIGCGGRGEGREMRRVDLRGAGGGTFNGT
jgi:hypothetical protein